MQGTYDIAIDGETGFCSLIGVNIGTWLGWRSCLRRCRTI